jgi:hypothetical protein
LCFALIGSVGEKGDDRYNSKINKIIFHIFWKSRNSVSCGVQRQSLCIIQPP